MKYDGFYSIFFQVELIKVKVQIILLVFLLFQYDMVFLGGRNGCYNDTECSFAY